MRIYKVLLKKWLLTVDMITHWNIDETDKFSKIVVRQGYPYSMSSQFFF